MKTRIAPIPLVGRTRLNRGYQMALMMLSQCITCALVGQRCESSEALVKFY